MCNKLKLEWPQNAPKEYVDYYYAYKFKNGLKGTQLIFINLLPPGQEKEPENDQTVQNHIHKPAYLHIHHLSGHYIKFVP